VVRQAAVIGAALVAVFAFFLPWMHGSSEFDYRTFSGFDFARLVRNFEITAGSPASMGQVRATAIALYLIPALAVNAVVFNGFALVNPGWSRAARLASATGAAYTLAVIGGLLLLSAVPVSNFADVVGWPSYGLAATAGAAFAMGTLGVFESRRFPTPRVEN
jgi:hypothetical protein